MAQIADPRRIAELPLKGALIEIRPLTWTSFEAGGQLLWWGNPLRGDEWPDSAGFD